MTTLLLVGIIVCLVMVLIGQAGARAGRGTPIQLRECPYCCRNVRVIEQTDFDGVSYHCSNCQGFIGARPLGTEPGSDREMLVKRPKGRESWEEHGT